MRILTVPNVTDLRDIQGAPGDVALLSSYSGSGSLRGVLLMWDESVAPDDGGSRFNLGGLESLSAGWQRLSMERVNVQEYGATGDGSTDDTAAIKRAIAASAALRKNLHFPAGVYIVSETLDFIEAADLSLFTNKLVTGEQATSEAGTVFGTGTVIRWTGPSSGVVVNCRARGMRFRGLTIYSSTGMLSAFDWDRSPEWAAMTAIRVEDVLIFGTLTNGIRIGPDGTTLNLEYGVFRNVHVSGATNAGLLIASTTGQAKYQLLESCKFNACGYGIRALSGSFVTRSCSFGRCTISAVSVHANTDTVAMYDTDSESCKKLFETTGSGGSGWPVLICNARFGTSDTCYPYPEGWITFQYPAGLKLINVLLDHAGTFDQTTLKAYVGGATHARLTSIGCTYLGPVPWDKGNSAGLTVHSQGDCWHNRACPPLYNDIPTGDHIHTSSGWAHP